MLWNTDYLELSVPDPIQALNESLQQHPLCDRKQGLRRIYSLCVVPSSGKCQCQSAKHQRQLGQRSFWSSVATSAKRSNGPRCFCLDRKGMSLYRISADVLYLSMYNSSLERKKFQPLTATKNIKTLNVRWWCHWWFKYSVVQGRSLGTNWLMLTLAKYAASDPKWSLLTELLPCCVSQRINISGGPCHYLLLINFV